MSSSLRRPTIDDLPEIEDIAAKYTDNPLPEQFIQAAVVEINDDVVAFGVLRNHLEALLYCDGLDREKVEALKLLIAQGIQDARRLNADTIYVYAQDENFAKVLENKFKFRRINRGIPMILDL